MPTTIEVRDADWTRLSGRKQPGDGFKDVISRILDQLEEAEEQGFVSSEPATGTAPDPEPEQRDLHETGQREPAEETVDPNHLYGIEEHVRHGLPTRGKSEDDVSAMLEAVSAAIDYIRTHGEVGQNDLERALYEEHNGPYGSETSWYKRMLKPGLKAAIEAGDVGIEAPVNAGDKWESV